MRKIFFYIFALLAVALLAAAYGHPGGLAAGQTDKLKVVTTIFAPYDFVRVLAGDKAEIHMLVPPGAETHSFEPAPRDIIRVKNCDVFIQVGGDSDKWVGKVLQAAALNEKRVFKLMDQVAVVEEELVEGMQAEHDGHGGEEGKHEETAGYDEHVWTSPRNAKLIVRALAAALGEADPANAAFYQQNAKDYLAKLDDLDAGFRAAVDKSRRKTVAFADRFPFRYLAEAYGLAYFAAFPGCSTETEPSAATVAFLIDKIKQEKIPVVFHAELSNERMADMISEATGAKKLLLHACHNVSKADFLAGASYLSLMAQNVQNLREALN